MKVIPPLTLTDSMVTSTLAEPDASLGEVLWVAYNPYSVGDVVILTSTHKKYKCVNNVTSPSPPNLDPTNWLEIGWTNKWAMFYAYRTSQSILAANNTTVTLTPGQRINSIAILGANVGDITLTVSDGTSTIYSHSHSMTFRDTNTYTDYFFNSFNYRKSLVAVDIPPVTSPTITVAITGAGTISNISVGTNVNIGDIQIGVSVEALNFSKIDRDIYGNSTLIRRRSVPKTVQNIFTNKINVTKLLDLRQTLNAVPAVWCGIDDNSDDYFDALLIMGIYKEFTINMEHPDHAIVSLQLEEV